MKEVVIARSWREFNKQQFVAICELLRVFKGKTIKIHLNINGEVNSEYVTAIKSALANDSELIIYDNQFLNDFARSHQIPASIIEQFSKWQWIYHILLYYYLYQEGIPYILTYDDDILFKTRDIGEVFHDVEHHIPFSIKDQHYDADKCMMGKLCHSLGAWVSDEYLACSSNDMPTNSGFMGFLTKIFEPFDSLFQIVSLFEFKEWNHKTMQGSEYDTYKILLQEQSFLGIMSRATSNRTHIVLHEKEGYLISSDLDIMNKSKILHYVGILKYEDKYLEKLNTLYNIYRQMYIN